MTLKQIGLAVVFIGTLSSGCATTQLITATSNGVQQMQNLSQQQQAIVPIAAFAAIGDIQNLNQALNQGLDHGLSINEIKAVLVQVYAYAGFPRSLNAFGTFMQAVEQRKAQGIQDTEGNESSALPLDYHALKNGTENQTKLVGQAVSGPLFDFAPEIDEYLKAHLFGDIFARDVLSWQDREIATVSMLAAMSGTESQLQSHVNMSLNIGVTMEQLQDIQQLLKQQVSHAAGEKLTKILEK